MNDARPASLAGEDRGARLRLVGSFFRLLELDIQNAADHPNTLDRIRSGDVHAVLLRDVYPDAVLSEVVGRLEKNSPPFIQTWFPRPFRAYFYGRNLNLEPPDLFAYFADSERFHQQLAELFPPGLGLIDRVSRLLSQLDHGRECVAPPGPSANGHYMFTTIRAHSEGGFIPPHFDNEQALRPSYRHLRTLIEPHLLSFVLAFSRPEGGGTLDFFNHRADPLAKTITNVDHAPPPDVSSLEYVSIRLAPGSLILADSGRFLHRVATVEGPRKRWVACSFLAKARHRDAVYCWG